MAREKADLAFFNDASLSHASAMTCVKGGKHNMLGIYNYTVVLTYIGMLSGFTGVTFAI